MVAHRTAIDPSTPFADLLSFIHSKFLLFLYDYDENAKVTKANVTILIVWYGGNFCVRETQKWQVSAKFCEELVPAEQKSWKTNHEEGGGETV